MEPVLWGKAPPCNKSSDAWHCALNGQLFLDLFRGTRPTIEQITVMDKSDAEERSGKSRDIWMHRSDSKVRVSRVWVDHLEYSFPRATLSAGGLTSPSL